MDSKWDGSQPPPRPENPPGYPAGKNINTVPSKECAVGGATGNQSAGNSQRRPAPAPPTSSGSGSDGQGSSHGPRTPGDVGGTTMNQSVSTSRRRLPTTPPTSPGGGSDGQGSSHGPRTPGDGCGDGNTTHPLSASGGHGDDNVTHPLSTSDATLDSRERMQSEVLQSKGGHPSSSSPRVESTQFKPEEAWERLNFSITYGTETECKKVTFDASRYLDACKVQFAMTKRYNLTMDTLQDKQIQLALTSSSIEFHLPGVGINTSVETLKMDLIAVLKEEIIQDLDIMEIGMDHMKALYVLKNLQKRIPPAIKNNKAGVYHSDSKRMIYIVAENNYFEKVHEQLTAVTESDDEGTQILLKSDVNLTVEYCVLLEDLNFHQFVRNRYPSTSLKMNLGQGPEFVSGTDLDLKNVEESLKYFLKNIVRGDLELAPWKFQCLFRENGGKNESVHSFLKNWVSDELALEKGIQFEVLFHLQKVGDVAVLIGCSEYEVLKKVKYVLDNMERFQGTLAPGDENFKWFNTCIQLGKVHVISRTEKVAYLLCRKDILSWQELNFPPLIMEFFTSHGNDVLDQAGRKFGVNISLSSDVDAVIIKGEQKLYKGVKKFLKAEIEAMRMSIPLDLTEEVVLRKKEEIGNAASNNKCSWKIQPATRQTPDSKLAGCKYLVSWSDPLGALKIHAVQAHPGKLALDMLILLVNDSLYPLHDVDILGLAGEEFLVAGHEFHKKPLHLGKTMLNNQIGNLRCTYEGAIVICAKQKFIDQKTFTNSFVHMLDEGNKKGLKRVGIPAGLMTQVVDDVDWRRGIVEGCIQHFSKNNKSKIQEIFICCDQSSSLKAVQEVNQHIGNHFQHHGYARKVFENGLLEYTVPMIKVGVQTGLLHEAKAEILVNTTKRCLKLDDGVVSRKLLAEAGSALQEECKEKYPQGITDRSFAVTRSHRLKNKGVKYIVHGVLPDFSKGSCRTDVKRFVTTCLYEADRLGLKRNIVAFPAIGVGQMSYPRRDVAEAMFDAVEEYRQEAVNAEIKEVKFVVFDKDQPTCEAFLTEEWRRSKTIERQLDTKFQHGRVPNCRSFQKRSSTKDSLPLIKVVVSSEVGQLPSHAVDVELSVACTSFKHKPAMDYVKTWNDEVKIPMGRNIPEKQELSDSMKTAITWCASQRVTEVLFNMCMNLHLSEVEQVALMAECLLQEKDLQFLQTVYIAVSDEESLKQAEPFLKKKEGFMDKNKWEWSSGEERVEDHVTVELVGQTKMLLDKAKSDILGIVQDLKKEAAKQQQLQQQQYQLEKQQQQQKELQMQQEQQQQTNSPQHKHKDEKPVKALQQSTAGVFNDQGARPKTGNKNAGNGMMRSQRDSRLGMAGQGAENPPPIVDRKKPQRQPAMQPSKKNEGDVAKVQSGAKDAGAASDVIVKAEISPAIMKKKGTDLERWLQKVEQEFKLEILPGNNTTCVKGSLQKILEFEKYLDKDFPLDPVSKTSESGAAMADSGSPAGGNRIVMDDSYFSDECSVEMDELEYAAIPYLLGVEMAKKLKHMTYNESKKCMVFSTANGELMNRVQEMCTQIRQEKREIILTEMDECLEASNVCESVQKPNDKVFCHFIPEKSKIVIFGSDRKNVSDAEFEICVQLGRKPPVGGGGPPGAVPVPSSPPVLGRPTGSDPVSSHPPSGMRYPPDMKEYQKGGLTVKVYTENILQLPVDCIVVSDQLSLRSGSGVAKIVRLAAGKEYEDECDRTSKASKGLKEGQCVLTSAGALTHYKGVVHVYLPVSKQFKEREQLEIFEKSIVNCLETADGKGFTSVALPCIGTGLNGFPIEKCAQQYFSALDRFSKTAMAVSDVHFVDVNPTNIKQVNATFEKHSRQEKKNSSQMSQRHVGSLSQSTHPCLSDPNRTVTANRAGDLSISLRNVGYEEKKAAFGNHGSKSAPLENQSGSEPYVFYTTTGVQIVITQGDITAADVDAIVSIEDAGFSGAGAIASAILSMSTDAYRSSHRSLKTSFPKNQTKVGKAVHTFTDSPRIKCKYVFHAVAPHWSRDYTKAAGAFERDLGHTMDSILSRAKETNVYSLAVPLLGASDSREMHTPLDTCCREMVRSVIQFLKETKVPSLGEIHFVSPDVAAVHSLRAEVENQLAAEDQGASSTSSPEEKTLDRFKKKLITSTKDIIIDMSKRGHVNLF